MERITLVFPSSIAASLTYSRKARERGERIIASSSLAYDETSHHYEHWIHLPSIYAAEFDAAFIAAIEAHGITHFYSPHAMVYSRVSSLIAQRALPLSMAEDAPLDVLNRYYSDLLLRSAELRPFFEAVSGREYNPTLLASLMHHGEQIYGQTNETKMAAMAAVFEVAPAGDVIEIGSAWGRSAFMLAMLAQHHGTGSVLCIDPWDEEEASQKDSPDAVENENRAVDWDHMFRIFSINLFPFAGQRLNYARMTSKKAHDLYVTSPHVSSPLFGTTAYTQRASVIHIDGNHDYSAVSLDCALWKPHVVSGGWLIIDDYVWEHGNGPRLMGDAILHDESVRIERAFVAGKALFIQFRSGSA